MSQMLKSSGAMGVATLTSRFLGMGREILYARFMGTEPIAAAFKMAFMIPNLFRRLLGEGALTAAFIPIFKEKERLEGEEEMWRCANAVISGLVVAASVIIALVLLGISLALATDAPRGNSAVIATVSATADSVDALPSRIKTSFPSPGWLGDDTRAMLELARIMFPYLLLICLAAIFMGMLNARGHFFVPALGAAVLNSILIAVVLIAPLTGKNLRQQVFALAFGVLVAGAAQAAYQLPSLRREGFRYRWISPWGDPTVHEVVRKMVPGMMGVAAFQLNVVLTQGIAWTVDPTIVASFDYAVRLMELPQGIFGISLATYLLPLLSGLAAEKNYGEFRKTLGQGLGYLSFANMLASVLLVVLARPIVRLIFEHGGKFGPAQTEGVALALACLAPGLIAFSIVNILARAFYALGDMKTPMKISCFCLGLNVIFALWAIRSFRQGGLGIANTMSAGFNVWLLFYALRRKLARLDLGQFRPIFLTMCGAALFSGVIASLLSRFWETHLGHRGILMKLGAALAPMAAATIVYFAILLWLKIPQAHDYAGLVRNKFRKSAA